MTPTTIPTIEAVSSFAEEDGDDEEERLSLRLSVLVTAKTVSFRPSVSLADGFCSQPVLIAVKSKQEEPMSATCVLQI